MRIVHIVAAITEEASGPSYSVLRLCEELICLGYDLTLAVLDWRAGFSYPSFVKPFPLGFGPRRLSRSPAMKHWLLEQASQGKIDIIHNHGIWMMPNIYPGDIARKYRLSYIVSPHGTLLDWAFRHGSNIKRIFWPLFQRPSLETVSCFHATSEDEYQDIRRRGFMQPVAIIPNGIDISNLPHESRDKENKTLLFLGRIHKIKGLDILIEAWAKVEERFPNWVLQIVGPDERGYLRDILELASRLKVKRVEFKGPAYGKDKWEAYRSADIFVLTSYSENFGIVVAEALAAGTPAIVSKGAPWEILPKIGAGWWIDISVDALFACLNEALNLSSETLEQMGIKGQRWIASEYSWRRIAEKTDQLYRWILSGGSTPEFIRTN